MVATKAKSSTKKATTAKKSTASRKVKSTANKVDYYPNRVPLLAAVAGVSFLMAIALLVAL